MLDIHVTHVLTNHKYSVLTFSKVLRANPSHVLRANPSQVFRAYPYTLYSSISGTTSSTRHQLVFCGAAWQTTAKETVQHASVRTNAYILALCLAPERLSSHIT